MAKDLNLVQVIGRLGKDPEIRYTPQGLPIAKFSVASGRRWRTTEGDIREATEWFNVVAMDRLAETCSQDLHKGSRVYIEGRLQTRSWDDQATGQKRYMTEVMVTDLILLEWRRDEPIGDAPEPDVGFGDQDIDSDRPEPAPRAQQPARATVSGDGASARPAPQRPAPATNGAARRPAAPPPEDDDLPF